MHSEGGGIKEIGQVDLNLRDILSGELKKTPQATVRVNDQYLPIKKAGSQAATGLLRCILYLEDLGEVSKQGGGHLPP